MKGRRLATRTFGEAGRALLWIHGYTLDSSVWAPIWSLLPGYRHVGVDLPGHGASADVDVPSLQAMAAEVLATAREVGASEVVAMSFGGMIALQAAIQASPGELTTVVLASPALGGGPQDPESLSCNVELVRMAAERGLGPWLHERWMATPPSIFAGLAKHAAPFAAVRQIVQRHSFRELTTGRMRDLTASAQGPRELVRIDANVLVLVGEDDMEAFKRIGELVRRAVPRCTRRYAEGSGHLCLLERPDLAAGHIESFLRAHARAGSP